MLSRGLEASFSTAGVGQEGLYPDPGGKALLVQETDFTGEALKARWAAETCFHHQLAEEGMFFLTAGRGAQAGQDFPPSPATSFASLSIYSVTRFY